MKLAASSRVSHFRIRKMAFMPIWESFSSRYRRRSPRRMSLNAIVVIFSRFALGQHARQRFSRFCNGLPHITLRVCNLKLMNILRRLDGDGKTILFISHALEMAASFADGVVFVQSGLTGLDGSTRDAFSKLEESWLRQVSLLSKMFDSSAVFLTVDEFCERIAPVQSAEG